MNEQIELPVDLHNVLHRKPTDRYEEYSDPFGKVLYHPCCNFWSYTFGDVSGMSHKNWVVAEAWRATILVWRTAQAAQDE